MSAYLKTTEKHLGGRFPCNLFIVLLLFFFSLQAMAQEVKPGEKVTIGNAQFILHTVQKKETLYSISKKYDCTQEEILAANRNISGMIKKGMILKIPDHAYQKPQPASTGDNSFIRHQVVSGDNYYQLKLKYGVEEEELLKFNPELKDGLKAGKTILVPGKSISNAGAKESSANTTTAKSPAANMTPDGKQVAGEVPYKPVQSSDNSKILNVGLYLPISAAMTDSLKPSAKTLGFLAFFEGAMVAADQLAKTGLKTKLTVYDTEKMASMVDLLVTKPEILTMDLLIGPVYPELQKKVSDVSVKNKIPMVSPFSSDGRYTKTNPFYFQIIPERKLRMEATADYLFREFSKEKITFLENENGSQETRLIHERLKKKRLSGGVTSGQLVSYNLWAKGTEELESKLQVNESNILVMAETNEANISIAMNRLALLSKKIPLVLIGIQEYTRMQSIEIESLHNSNLRFLATSYIDYNHPAVINFVEHFKNEFGTEPSSSAFLGYDITTYFLRSLQKTGDLSHGIQGDFNEGLLQSSYHFSKVSQSGGYTNHLFSILEYSNTYEIRSLGVIQHEQ